MNLQKDQMNLHEQFGPLVPSSVPPTRETLLHNLEQLRTEFERLRDLHDRKLEPDLRAVQLGIRSLMRDLQQRFPDDHARLVVELAALLNFRAAAPQRVDRTGRPTITLQQNFEAIGYNE